MSYINTLCTDPQCTKGCWHMGPQGQLCYFEVEKALCRMLGIPWTQEQTLDKLMVTIQDKLEQVPTEDDYDAQIKLAQRLAPNKPASVPVLSAHDEDQ